MFEEGDQDLDNYLPSRLEVETSARMKPVAGIAARHLKRMQAQHSVFTVTYREQTPIDQVDSQKDNNHIGRYVIPSSSKEQIREELAALQITRLSIFPDLDNVARRARRPYHV